MKHKRPPIPVIVVVLLLLVGGGYWWWWTSQAGATASTALTGSIEAEQYQVPAAISAPVVEVKVVEGDQVTAGQVLVQLDDSAIRLQLEGAKQGVTAAKAALRNARDDDDSTDADIDAAQAKVNQAKAAANLVRVQLGYARVTAPHAGRVVTVSTNAGQNAAPGRTLITLTDPADLFVRVFVPETGIGSVKMGQAAHLTTDSSTQTFSGTVSYIASESEFTPNNVQTREQRTKLVYEVRVRIADDSGTLKAGMPVDVSFG
ncbi:MAG TPA: HlyD family efflux transporter periplasmic adaptor subunit [Propionicimonas sp.]|nr:HlyD family efflux transporter periplasmic adaptor subunit [Propionicimonas sp.]